MRTNESLAILINQMGETQTSSNIICPDQTLTNNSPTFFSNLNLMKNKRSFDKGQETDSDREYDC